MHIVLFVAVLFVCMYVFHLYTHISHPPKLRIYTYLRPAYVSLYIYYDNMFSYIITFSYTPAATLKLIN